MTEALLPGPNDPLVDRALDDRLFEHMRLERDILRGKVEELETELADVMGRWQTNHAALVQVRQENRVLLAQAGKLAGAGGADEG